MGAIQGFFISISPYLIMAFFALSGLAWAWIDDKPCREKIKKEKQKKGGSGPGTNRHA